MSLRSDSSLINEHTTLLNSSVEHHSTSDDEGGIAKAAVQGTGATVFSSYINLTNTCLGAGSLAIPFAISKAGFALGLVLLVLAAAAGGFLGLYLLAESARMLHQRSGNQRITYYSASQATYPRARLLIDGAIALKCFGVAMSYLVVIGDLSPQVAGFLAPSLGAVSPLRNRNFYIASSALLIAPLAFQRTLHSIRYASYMSLVWMAYLLFIVAYFFVGARQADAPWPEIDLVPRDWSILPNLPIFVFSFTCHQNLFTIYSELPNAAGARINSVVTRSVGTAIGLYLLLGIGGYLTYGAAVSGDLLESYPKDVVSTIARMGIVLNVALSYPLQCNPARRSFTAIFFKGDSSGKPTPAQEDRQFVALTVAMLLGTYGIAFSGINLSLVFSIVGALGSTSICYVLPGLFYWKLTEGTTSGLRYAAAAMICTGLCITTVSMTMIVVSGGGGGI